MRYQKANPFLDHQFSNFMIIKSRTGKKMKNINIKSQQEKNHIFISYFFK